MLERRLQRTQQNSNLSQIFAIERSSALDGVSSGGVELVVHTQDEAFDGKEENEDTHHPVSSGCRKTGVNLQLNDELVVVVFWARVAPYVRVGCLFALLSLS